jgi:hypothetical protein
MTERIVPCVFDPRRDCPIICRVRRLSEEVLESAEALGVPNPGQFSRELFDNMGEAELASSITTIIGLLSDPNCDEEEVPLEKCFNKTKSLG